jgi:cytochrome c
MKQWMPMGLVAGALVVGSPALAQSGNAERGERLFNQQCKNCHTVEKGGAQTLGPNLSGMFGRKAGSIEGFKASDAMKASGIAWDDAVLADYLKDPKGRVPGTTMVHAGLKRPEQLADVIAYLKKVTP